MPVSLGPEIWSPDTHVAQQGVKRRLELKLELEQLESDRVKRETEREMQNQVAVGRRGLCR